MAQIADWMKGCMDQDQHTDHYQASAIWENQGQDSQHLIQIEGTRRARLRRILREHDIFVTRLLDPYIFNLHVDKWLSIGMHSKMVRVWVGVRVFVCRSMPSTFLRSETSSRVSGQSTTPTGF